MKQNIKIYLLFALVWLLFTAEAAPKKYNVLLELKRQEIIKDEIMQHENYNVFLEDTVFEKV